MPPQMPPPPSSEEPTPKRPVPPSSTSGSPNWGSTTKMVVGLTIVGIIAALLVQFRAIIGPLILAFILAYLLHSAVTYFSQATRLSWRMSVNIIYLLLVILLGGAVTLTGLAVIQQLQNLIGVVNRFVAQLPAMVADLSTRVYTFGPFELNFSQFDFQTLTNQILSTVQPLLGRVGGLVSTLATSAAVSLGWGLFVLVVSYFLLADASQFPNALVRVEIPGYYSDIRRLGRELRLIWDSYIRGQLVITLLVVITYSILMMALGLRNVAGIAILAGLARFVPYAGPATTWTVTTLVAFFQPSNYFGLPPFQYAVLVVGAAVLVDQIFDNLIVPRYMGQTLGVHPAGVLIAAIVALNLLGIVGLVLAAPVLASITLISRYILRKMFDLDPWPEPEKETDNDLPWETTLRRLQARWRMLRRRMDKD